MRKAIIILGFFLINLWGCQGQQPVSDSLIHYRQTRLALGTIINLDVCATGQSGGLDQVYQKAWDKIEEINREMNIYRNDSEGARINGSQQKPVTVSPDMYSIIEKSVAYSHLTRGAFDITVLPLMFLWQKAERTNQYPSGFKVKEIKSYIGSDKIQLLANSQVALLHPKAGVDFGAIAAGYAADAVAAIFRQGGFDNLYIDTGGEIFVGGYNCEKNVWQIGIKHPRLKNKIIEVVGLHDQGIATSGSYERYFLIQNEKWSRIINPITGYPQKGLISATVIAPNATIADALATALCVLPINLGLSLIDSLGDNYAAVIIEEEDRSKQLIMHKSQRYKNYRLR